MSASQGLKQVYGHKVFILDGSEDRQLLGRIASGEKIDYQQVEIAGLSPEHLAMMQALISRAPVSVANHIEKVLRLGPEKFMQQYYIGYGDKSIGDCGFVSIFIEGVSMLVAKAFQDNRLYNGQEGSTRYLDFGVMPFYDVLGTKESARIVADWRSFYEKVLADSAFRSHVMQLHPHAPGVEEKDYNKAVQARMFDIARGFLPLSATTYLAWTTNLRQAQDRLVVLLQHPMEEVRVVARDVLRGLQERYPNSFTLKETDDERGYRQLVAEDNLFAPKFHPDFEFTHSISTSSFTLRDLKIFGTRPKRLELPPRMEELGQVFIKFLLDVGSWRDLQRHRSGVIRFPLVTTQFGFYNWYFKELTPELQVQAHDLVNTQTERINQLQASDVDKQGYLSLGFSVPVQMAFGLPALVYTMERRSASDVHPTLRARIHETRAAFTQVFPMIPLHADMNTADFTARRGKQTILNADGSDLV